jgi:hypothetical protein
VDDELPQRIRRFGLPYQTNALPKDTTGRKPKKNVNSRLEPSHELNFPISVPKLAEGMSLILKNSKYCCIVRAASKRSWNRENDTFGSELEEDIEPLE